MWVESDADGSLMWVGPNMGGALMWVESDVDGARYGRGLNVGGSCCRWVLMWNLLWWGLVAGADAGGA